MKDYKYCKSQKVINLCLWPLCTLDTVSTGNTQRTEVRKQAWPQMIQETRNV